MGHSGLWMVIILAMALATSGCSSNAPKVPSKASQGSVLPREHVISLDTVNQVLAEMSRETATGHDETAVGKPTGTRSVTYATADGTQRVVISVDQYASSQDASSAYQQAYQASQKVPGVKGESVSDLGQQAFIGIVTQGKETHVGGGALYGDSIVTVTLQGYDGTKENIARVVSLIRKQADAPAASTTEKRDVSLTEAIQKGMKRASVPGAIVGVWREGQPPYLRALGVRDTASGEPMTTDLHLRIGSNTKAFVTTAILMLADQGKLGLDDPIDRYVKGVPSGDKITLRQLAQMRSGLFNYSDDTSKEMPKQPLRKWTPQELLEAAFRHPLVFPPGTRFDYCNTNTVLLGLVVEKVSGKTLASFIEQNILKPEGMTHTVFPAGAELPSPYSHGYFKLPDGKIVDATNWNPSWGWAAGNMISTLEDMRVWTRDLALGKLISPALKKEQQQFLPAPEEGDGALYGLALENQNGWIGHNGNIMSYMVYPYYLPSEQMTMVVMLNSGVDIPASWLMIQDITRIISPKNIWPGLPKEEK